MLALPAPRHAAVFYHVVIQDLCAAIPTFPKMMAKVVGQMFAQIARMDVEARERLADWMAHHLSCFDLAWPWKSWAHVAAQDKRHPQRRFCESVVKRLCRSCFQKRVSDSLPDELRDALMPAYACSSNGKGLTGLNARYLESLEHRTRFRASQGTGEETNALAELGDLLRRKTPSDEIVKWFESSGAREQLGDVSCAETLTAAALRHGQKCLTHHDVLLKRYSGALAEFSSKEGATEGAQSAEVGAAIVAAASGVWSGTHPRMAVAAVSRLVALEVVAPSAVAKWLETYAFDVPNVSDDEEASDYLSGTRWGTEDAFEIAAEAVGARVAAARQTESVANDAETRRREAERAASAAEAAREDAEQRDALTQRDQFARTAQAHRDRALAFERERSAAAGPAAAARRAAAEAAAAAGASLARGVVKMKGAEAAAARLRGASATGKDAGRDAAPETRAYRAMALAAAALRRMRDVGGAALESATAAAATAAGLWVRRRAALAASTPPRRFPSPRVTTSSRWRSERLSCVCVVSPCV
jgi:nuclear cap-binding protein subunit 1